MDVRACRLCGNPIDEGRRKHGAVYCSTPCGMRARAKAYREANPLPFPGIPTGMVGAISELAVAMDLMGSGYHVFRAISPSCPADLVVLIGGKALTVEVRTGYISGAGTKYWAHMGSNKADHWGIFIATTKEILYDPPLPSPE